MTAALWIIAFSLLALLAITLIAFDRSERHLDLTTRCGCPEHAAGGTCAEGGAA